jgi:hypothetical protein
VLLWSPSLSLSPTKGERTKRAARQGFVLGPGKYRFHVEMADDGGATAGTSNHLRIGKQVLVVGDATHTCSLSGNVWSGTLSKDTDKVDLEFLRSALPDITEDSVVWIEAWGANGGNGYSSLGGDAGRGAGGDGDHAG